MNRLGSAQAKDYGHSVVEVGFDGLGVNPEHYVPQVGDIAIFPEVPDHPAGHIQYYTSNGWVSDTVQKHFLPRSAYKNAPVEYFRNKQPSNNSCGCNK